MPAVRNRRPSVIASVAAVAAAAALFAFSGCAGIKSAPLSNGAGGGGGAAVNGGGGHNANSGGGRNGAAGGPASLPDAGACVKVACTQPTGQYCGKIGDGCNDSQDCGTCPGDQICEKGVCVQGASCVPATCPTTGVLNCGKIGDGCGRALDCGTCPTGFNCSTNGVCIDPGCVPKTCNGPNGVQYCGMIGDGCGGALNCSCTGGLTCGGGGVPGVCGAMTCPPPLQTIQCNPTGGGQYCGTIGNGCGGVVTCPTTCPMGAACPANGVCPGSTSTGCQNLQCQIQTCTPTTKTSISGTVFDPAGKNPLYNVQVYIPNTINGLLDPVPEGVSCDQCSVTLSGFPIATALTDPMGHFTITNAPSGANIPLVIQIGKWRREVFLPTVNPCVDNPVAAALTHLPRDQTEGHIPRIAVTTGAADALECLLRRVGIADSEFTTDAGTGRVHLYAGGGGTSSFMTGATPFSPATALWSSPTKLAAYDVLLMSCEGSTSMYAPMKPQTSVDNVANYANSGGRLFLSHLHFYWLQHRIDFNSTAAYIGNLQAPGATSSTLVDLTINQNFPKGMALAQWLAGPLVMASPTLGTIQVAGSEHSVTGIVPPTTEWIYLPSNTRDTPLMRRSEQYLSFNTPVGTPEAMQCGKVVFTDIHIQQSIGNGAMGGDDSDPGKPFPSGCKTNPSTPQAKALEFLFFDLSACVQPDTQQPQPPLVPPPGVPTSPPPSAPPPPRVPPPPPPPPPMVIP